MNAEPVLIDFYRYPPIGTEDWRYAYTTATIRTLEMQLLSRALLSDLINADRFEVVAEMLSQTDYAISPQAADGEIEAMLLECRGRIRRQFVHWMLDPEIVRMFRCREDFTNMRLALRRVVIDRPLGTDYSSDGAIAIEEFEEIFQEENYERLPECMQEAVEAAVLGYYKNKDIREIDYAIDRAQALWRIRRYKEIGSEFGLSMSRIRIDLYNLRTLMRLKFAQRDESTYFLQEGFVERDRFVQGLDLNYDSLAALFFATPYFELVEEGTRYFRDRQSFLALERGCEDYLMGFLKTTRYLIAGCQPVIAYLLMKEAEIRTVRMILTGKKNGLEPSLMMDRLGAWIE